MIKKLDLLILKAFVGPFLATFLITFFVFMMQILWKYIDDLVGKGLDFLTLIEFTLYASATLVTFALPISILLSSIMTFGKLGENFELVAIKSSGISLLRFMAPLLVVTILLSGVAFLFANNITPVANLKFARIYHDIYTKRPAFDLKPGIFYNGFQGFSIKISDKKQDSILKDIIIYEITNTPQDNTILAKSGKMVLSKDKNFLEFQMDTGHRYSFQYDYNPQKEEFVQLGFKKYTKLFDMTQFNMQQTADSLFTYDIRMKTMGQLNEDLDSLQKLPSYQQPDIRKNISILVGAERYRDTAYKRPQDSTAMIYTGDLTLSKMVPDSIKNLINEMNLSKLSSLKETINSRMEDHNEMISEVTKYRVERNKKLSVAVSCIVLFLIGAPLGSIIRRGGVGLPLVMAVLFFMVYYLLGTFGEKFALDQVFTPLWGVFFPVIILTPVALFLTYKAQHDSQLFNREFYYRMGKSIKKILKFKNSPVVAIK